MKLHFVRSYRRGVFIGTAALLVIGIVYAVVIYDRNYMYYSLRGMLVNGEYYLDNSEILEHNDSTYGFDSDGDLHIRISKERAREMIRQDGILKDCHPKKQKGCPDPTWQTYAHYNRVTYKGSTQVHQNNLAIPTILEERNEKDILCTMYQSQIDDAYGLCVNPKTGDIWYHYYAY